MNKRECKNCVYQDKCESSFSSWLFFVLGIISAISIRITTFLMHLNPIYAKISWYIGVGGFFMFFVYKFKILQSDSVMIKKQHILEKIDSQEKFSAEDYKLIERILCALSSKKERINYLFIFGLSAVALVVAVYLDFFKY